MPDLFRFRFFKSGSQWIVGGFFGILLGLGLWLHDDYGVSWDEPNNHLNGLVSAKYLAQLVAPELVARQASSRLIPDIQKFADADHGVAFELPLALLSFVFTHGDSQAFYRLRHFCIFLVFVLGVWALYQLAKQRFESWHWGLLAAGLLVLSPRFFAESFYNGKDIVYMALFTLALYTLTRLLQRPTLGRAVIHGLATALAVDVRVQGLLLLLVSVLMLGLEARYRAPAERGQLLRVGGIYSVAALTLTVLGWPYLWALPWKDLLAATKRINQYPWHGRVVYFGRVLPGTQLPWHYIPTWIIITTPLPYILATLAGVTAWMWEISQRGRASLSTFAGRLDLLFVSWLLVPVLLVIVLRPVVYDGWRHLYFIYPALVLLAVRGVHTLITIARQRPQWRPLAMGAFLVVIFGMVHAAWRIVRDHPHQQTYFSILPPSYAQRNFDLDYWGLSYRQGLEWVLAHDQAPNISVYSPWPSGHLVYTNSLILPPTDRARLRFANYRNADYILTNYRYRTQYFPDTIGREVHTIRVNGVRILSVFRRTGQ
ncbi:glycosyltransferase family 39 protein [Hymenobacter sp. BT188]|uniref:glycosyltransferase family 39 protein n=1 Tax=Hymenobacter sp. BT188 TaxID=2763504 RepID=UPI001650D50E|nr:glycosyltransferase family 39 protein [Hymenobacter sp. BT188]MBC6608343.1 glycosyltransferase family 39 protein [Hymenobacter sp. BT188]